MLCGHAPHGLTISVALDAGCHLEGHSVPGSQLGRARTIALHKKERLHMFQPAWPCPHHRPAEGGDITSFPASLAEWTSSSSPEQLPSPSPPGLGKGVFSRRDPSRTVHRSVRDTGRLMVDPPSTIGAPGYLFLLDQKNR